MTTPWPDRVRAAVLAPPAVLYHATTPKKLSRYRSTGTILPPVRGFDTREACEEFMRQTGRTIMLRVRPALGPWPLPDHHRVGGVAWWTTDIEEGWDNGQRHRRARRACERQGAEPDITAEELERPA